MTGQHHGAGPRIAGTIPGDMHPCWQCGKSVSSRAVFCHACGAVQAPRDMDHFARLGVERRFDIDLEQLARQHAGFGRALEPARFASRGARQQTLARAQVEALDRAYDVLRDPVRRARYLMDDDPPHPVNLRVVEEEVAPLRAGLEGAVDCAAVDRVAAEAAHRVVDSIRSLAVHFRAGRIDEAALALARLEALESIGAEARARRAVVQSSAPPSQGLQHEPH